MKRLALCLLAMAVPCTAFAQDGIDLEANMNIHVVPAGFSQRGGACSAYDGEGGDCASSSHAGGPGAALVYIVASNIDGWSERPDEYSSAGIGAIQFGIEYSDLNVQTWFLCTGGQEVPQGDVNGTWPENGTGNAATWPGGCYDPGGENALVGVLVVEDGSTGSIQITADPRKGAMLAAYTDCNAFTWEIRGLWGADLDDPSSGPQCGPVVPTLEKSWGQIKNMF